MTDPQVQWKKPAGRQQAGAANKIADLLRANPFNPETEEGWAIIEEYPVPVYPEGADEDAKEKVRAESKKVRAKASSRASLIKQGRVAAFRSQEGTAGAFDAVSRSEFDDNGVRVIRVYAVYLGEEAAAEAAKAAAAKAETKAAAKANAAAADEPDETEGTVDVEQVEESVGASA